MFNSGFVVFENPKFKLPEMRFQFSEEKLKEEKIVEIVVHSNKIGKKKKRTLFSNF
ncbi:MAG: hypothetical protein FWC41_02960 [Firmicutes bacterium]|nr:hypothetical protein [Bacillota bacterium]